jgi:hypothetical protein
MNNWTWSNNTPCERSPRRSPLIKENQDNGQTDIEAQKQSLIQDDMWTSSFESLNKREDTYSKMADRQMISQIGQNPFLNNTYLDNVSFLQSVNTVEEKKNICSESEV